MRPAAHRDLEARHTRDERPCRNGELVKVQEWLGHADFSTTRLYDHRDSKPEKSPT